MSDEIIFDKAIGEWVLIPTWASQVERVERQRVSVQEQRDDLFSCALNFMNDSLTLTGCFPAEEVDEAAKYAIQFALSEGDRLAWIRIWAVFGRFTSRGLAPPMPILEGLAKVGSTFQYVDTLECAFGLDKGTRGRRQTPYHQRSREKSNAIAVALWKVTLETESVDAAVRKWAVMQDMGPGKSDSARQIRRDYDKHKDSAWMQEMLTSSLTRSVASGLRKSQSKR